MTLHLDDVSFIGEGLVRPECVLATAAGDLYSSDWRGGVSHLRPDGTQVLYRGATAELPEGPRPNGIALEPDGSFLFANLGSEIGGVWRIDRAGQISPVLREVDGVVLPPTNFVTRDRQHRLWVTVSTRVQPRSIDYRRSAATGFVVLVDGNGARIVADGLGFTNECAIDPMAQFLYVNETYARRLSRFSLGPNGDVGEKDVVFEFGPGQFPDGMAFDAEGNVWVASIISNQLIRVDPDKRVAEVSLEDGDRDHVEWVEQAYRADALGRPHMDQIRSRRLRNISNIAFGGTDLRTAFLGCLLGSQIARLPMKVAGTPPVHWKWPTTSI